ncbi:MAG: sensor histidine kinase [Clostridia bacterium]|nr:sensor histidine kinase [Clostridia bacterium]
MKINATENGMKKNTPLNIIFYRNFLLLIVIPILVIILLSMAIIQNIIMKSSIDKIELTQKNVRTTLENEILDNSLRLTHFLLTNDNQVLEFVAQHNMADNDGKYMYNLKLREQFNLIMPKTDILAMHFYMHDGSQYYFKDDLALSSAYIKNRIWYQKALSSPKSTYIGSELSTIMFNQRKSSNPQMTLAVALAPSSLDRYKKVEMVCMYIKSKAPDMIREYNRKPELGKMYLVDETGTILTGVNKEESAAIPKTLLTKVSGVYKEKSNHKTFNYIVNPIGMTDWKVISVVATSELLSTFYKISLGIISTAVLLFILFFIFSMIFLKNIIAPVSNLAQGMELMEQGDLHTQVEIGGAGEIRKLIHSFNKMAREINELVLSNERKEKEKHQEEIKALQSQINPHFLVNTLSSIRFMAIVAKFDSIKNMAEALIKILSCSFKSANSFYQVREEIEMLESYVFLMKVRYSDNFVVNFEIDETCLDCMVPRLIIQPILENCIVHGFEDLEEVGIIHVKVYQEVNSVIFMIKDNGKGMSHEAISEILSMDKDETSIYKGIGVSNVNRRIQLNYGLAYGIKMHSELGNYTETILNIPAIHKGE